MDARREAMLTSKESLSLDEEMREFTGAADRRSLSLTADTLPDTTRPRSPRKSPRVSFKRGGMLPGSSPRKSRKLNDGQSLPLDADINAMLKDMLELYSAGNSPPVSPIEGLDDIVSGQSFVLSLPVQPLAETASVLLVESPCPEMQASSRKLREEAKLLKRTGDKEMNVGSRSYQVLLIEAGFKFLMCAVAMQREKKDASSIRSMYETTAKYFLHIQATLSKTEWSLISVCFRGAAVAKMAILQSRLSTKELSAYKEAIVKQKDDPEMVAGYFSKVLHCLGDWNTSHSYWKRADDYAVRAKISLPVHSGLSIDIPAFVCYARHIMNES